jgi:hypothetical protein
MKPRLAPRPFGLSLSKPSSKVALSLRHGVFDKLRPLLRTNGGGFHASCSASRHGQLT